MADFVRTRMTTKEYAALPESNQPMELIYGEIVILPSPKDDHQKLSMRLSNRIFNHIDQNNLGEMRVAPTDVYLDDEEDVVVQPDIFFIARDNQQCRLEADNYWHGSPDLCVEIVSPGSGKRDRVTKFDLYEKYGVREYWIVEPEERYVVVYVLDNGTYKRQGAYDETQPLSSTVLTGLTLNLAEVFPAKEV